MEYWNDIHTLLMCIRLLSCNWVRSRGARSSVGLRWRAGLYSEGHLKCRDPPVGGAQKGSWVLQESRNPGGLGLEPTLAFLLPWKREWPQSLLSAWRSRGKMLSEEDDPIDRRPWTQQHLEAADIRRTPSLALTPPQAEQEVDVLDVNVRGPG